MGARGPKPMSARLHILRGNPSKKAESRLIDGVSPDIAVPRCPSHLSAEARREWKRITDELAALGLVAHIDRAALAGYCAAWAEVVLCEEAIAKANLGDPNGLPGFVVYNNVGNQSVAALVSVRKQAYDRMRALGADFGMTPAARARVTPIHRDSKDSGVVDEWSANGL